MVHQRPILTPPNVVGCLDRARNGASHATDATWLQVQTCAAIRARSLMRFAQVGPPWLAAQTPRRPIREPFATTPTP